MAGPFADTFVEASDQLLELHTPTGPNAGSGWTRQGSDGQLIVRSSTGLVEDNDFLSSNQYRMNDNLGFDEMDVQADFTELIGAGRCGVRVRLDPGDTTGWEFSYDANNSRWLITDGTSSTTTAEAWPGGTVTIKAEMRTGVGRLYVNSVLKVTHSSNLLSGRTYAGIQVLNFDSTGPEHQVDNYTSVGVGAVADPLIGAFMMS